MLYEIVSYSKTHFLIEGWFFLHGKMMRQAQCFILSTRQFLTALLMVCCLLQLPWDFTFLRNLVEKHLEPTWIYFRFCLILLCRMNFFSRLIWCLFIFTSENKCMAKGFVRCCPLSRLGTKGVGLNNRKWGGQVPTLSWLSSYFRCSMEFYKWEVFWPISYCEINKPVACCR